MHSPWVFEFVLVFVFACQFLEGCSQQGTDCSGNAKDGKSGISSCADGSVFICIVVVLAVVSRIVVGWIVCSVVGSCFLPACIQSCIRLQGEGVVRFGCAGSSCISSCEVIAFLNWNILAQINYCSVVHCQRFHFRSAIAVEAQCSVLNFPAGI